MEVIRISVRSFLFIGFTLLLIGCTSLSQKGLDSMNAGQYQAAYNTFAQCANQGDSYCINNIGFMYERGFMDVGADLDTAVHYYTLAARYGNTVAQNNLSLHGEPIPPVDLVVKQQQSASSNDAAMALILGSIANGYIEGQQRTRARHRQNQAEAQQRALLRQINKPIKCTSTEGSYGSVDTTCQ